MGGDVDVALETKSINMTSKVSLASIGILFIGLALYHAPNVQAHGHGHSHEGDPMEIRKNRWSKEANTQIQEDEILEEDIIDLPPQRGPPPKVNHGHGHGHGHSHGGHGHSHGPAQRELTPEEREKARQRLHKNWDDDDDEEVEGVNDVWRNALGATLLISI